MDPRTSGQYLSGDFEADNPQENHRKPPFIHTTTSMKRKSRPQLAVLNVKNDVLGSLDGADALVRLWCLFTKCKSGLQEGHRLENISWRLWSLQNSRHVGQRILDSVLNTAPAIPCSGLPTPGEAPLPQLQLDGVSLAPPRPILNVIHPTPNPTPPETPHLGLRGNTNNTVPPLPLPSPDLSLPPTTTSYPPVVYLPPPPPLSSEEKTSSSQQEHRPNLTPSSPATSSDTSITSLASIGCSGSDTSFTSTSSRGSKEEESATVRSHGLVTPDSRSGSGTSSGLLKPETISTGDRPQDHSPHPTLHRARSTSGKSFSTTNRNANSSSSSRSRSRSRDRIRNTRRGRGLLGMTSMLPSHSHRVVSDTDRSRPHFDIGSQGSGSGSASTMSTSADARSRSGEREQPPTAGVPPSHQQPSPPSPSRPSVHPSNLHPSAIGNGGLPFQSQSSLSSSSSSRKPSSNRGLSAMMHAQMTMTELKPPSPPAATQVQPPITVPAPPPPPSDTTATAAGVHQQQQQPADVKQVLEKPLTLSGVANGLGLNAIANGGDGIRNGEMRNQLEALFQVRGGGGNPRGVAPTTTTGLANPSRMPTTQLQPQPTQTHTQQLPVQPQQQQQQQNAGQSQMRLILSTSESDSDDWTDDDESGSFVSDDEEVTEHPQTKRESPVVVGGANGHAPGTVVKEDEGENSEDYEDVESSGEGEEEEEGVIQVVARSNRSNNASRTNGKRRGSSKGHARRPSGGSLKKEKEKEKEKGPAFLPRNVSTRQLPTHHQNQQIRMTTNPPPLQPTQQQQQQHKQAQQNNNVHRTGKAGGGRSQLKQPAPSVDALHGAALEAQRQRELFQKLPYRSYSGNLDANAAGPRRPGLLSQLMNPDPRIFPVEHPYRRGYSSGDVAGNGSNNSKTAPPRLGLRPLTPLSTEATDSGHTRRPAAAVPSPTTTTTTTVRSATTTSTSAGAAPAVTAPGAQHRRTASHSSVQRSPPPLLKKSAIANPVAQPVTASVASSLTPDGPVSKVVVGAAVAGPSRRRPLLQRTQTDNGGLLNHKPNRYGLKGRPAGAEMEDSSDDEPVTATNGDKNNIRVSSVAQETLKALAAQRGIVPKASSSSSTSRNTNNTRQSSSTVTLVDELPPWVKEQIDRAHQSDSDGVGDENVYPHEPARPQPLLLAFPYNLPHHADPSSPRTTRQLMLRTEMTESLRQNLLWTRQLQRNDLVGPRRKSSGAIATTLAERERLQQQVQQQNPHDFIKPVVQLQPKRPEHERRNSTSGTAPGGGGETFDPLGGLGREETRRLVLTRNKSFGGLYPNQGFGW